jgi:hypothetical protein
MQWILESIADTKETNWLTHPTLCQWHTISWNIDLEFNKKISLLFLISSPIIACTLFFICTGNRINIISIGSLVCQPLGYTLASKRYVVGMAWSAWSRQPHNWRNSSSALSFLLYSLDARLLNPFLQEADFSTSKYSIHTKENPSTYQDNIKTWRL